MGIIKENEGQLALSAIVHICLGKLITEYSSCSQDWSTVLVCFRRQLCRRCLNYTIFTFSKRIQV